jgi:hypothetical protein
VNRPCTYANILPFSNLHSQRTSTKQHFDSLPIFKEQVIIEVFSLVATLASCIELALMPAHETAYYSKDNVAPPQSIPKFQTQLTFRTIVMRKELIGNRELKPWAPPYTFICRGWAFSISGAGGCISLLLWHVEWSDPVHTTQNRNSGT